MYDVIIIGMGISGITAGIYAKRKGLNTLILEKNMPGGTLQKLNKITNYPSYDEISGPDLAIKLFNQIKKLEIPYKFEEVIKIENIKESKKVITNNNTYECHNIIIATGRKPKYLGLNNEKSYLGKGVSTCATCDGILYKNEDVAVVGSNNLAVKETIYLSGICHKVYLINKNDKLNCDNKILNNLLNQKNVEIINNAKINKINEDNNKINSIILDNNKTLFVKGIFIYVGYKPDTDIFNDLDILNINGDILVNKDFSTKIEGIYAVGDCVKKDVYQLITAASDAIIAITNINKE